MIYIIGISLLAFILWLYNNKNISGQRFLQEPPGPRGLPYFGYLPFLGKSPAITVHNLVPRWGDIIKLKLGESQAVFINGYENIKQISKLDVFQGRVYFDCFMDRGHYGLVLLEGDKWKEVRRFYLRHLKELGLGKSVMLQSISNEALLTREHLENTINEPVNIKPTIEVAVINSLWYLLAGEKYDINDAMKKRVLQIMTDGISDQNSLGIAAFLPTLAKLVPQYSGWNKGLEYFGAPTDLIKTIIKEHIATFQDSSERDLIDIVIKRIGSTDDPESMFYKDIGFRNLHYSLIDMFYAGSDTLSTTLGWSFLYLSVWPKHQDKVYQEIFKTFGHHRLPTYDERSSLPYTEATMHEILRASSIVPLGVFHKALEDFEFRGFLIKKNMPIITNLYGVHYDKNYWKDPKVFRPERFISNDGTFLKDEHVIPFATGKRSCPGESLAMMQYFLFFTTLLQKFEFQLNPNDPPPDLNTRFGFIVQPPKVNLILKPRF